MTAHYTTANVQSMQEREMEVFKYDHCYQG